MNINPLWLVSEQVPTELKTAYKQATRDKEAVGAATRTVAALHRLVDEAAFHTELQNAVHAAFTTGQSAVALLGEREAEVNAQIEAARSEKSVYLMGVAARQLEVQPMLKRCVIESSFLADEIAALETRIFRFAKERAEAELRLKGAVLAAV